MLLLARSQGAKIPDAIFARTGQALEAYRKPDGRFFYTNQADVDLNRSIPACTARAAVCEITLELLGGGSTDAIEAALGNFFKYLEFLDQLCLDTHVFSWRLGSTAT